ncbi:polyketide synthase [Geomesophilobacter sediminis]|uniref:Type I polyketide synthase n=1 Tax=Geomesophilobacter sediminis TaxID=2798584 RepID=A0A8J7JGY9_9BACT|nr:polyketide synthase [Geomesophilobacter sediminis]MBJ6726279.1 type I polyketide synthase [Geomesophilobacter sediminis]
MPQSASVAIVGIGGIFPDAPDLTRFWENIRLAQSAAREVPAGRWLISADAAYSPEVGAPDRVYSKRGCFIDAIPPLNELTGLALDTDQLEGLDPQIHLLLHAGKRAFDAGVTEALDRSRVGVIIGNLALPSEKSGALTREWLGRTFEEQLLGRALEVPGTNPLNRYVAGLPGGILAAALGLGGGSCTVDAACASSLYAIKLAADELLSGRADAMLAGGLSRPDPLYTQMGFSQLRALSRRGICSPFDAAGDGLVVGEGAGIFLLKRTEDAIAQGDRIYGIIRGIGLSNDIGGSLLAPMSEGQLRAMRDAYRQAGWEPQDADLVECHATGTPVGDATEVASLKELWGENGKPGEKCIIGSVKSNIGHLLTAAGSAALTKVLLSMANEILPPTAGFTTPQKGFDLEKSPFAVLQEARPWSRRADGVPRRAAVSAFGFGGINAHLLVEEYLPQQPQEGSEAVEIAATAPVASAAAKAKPCDIAVVGLDARFGPWKNLADFQRRVLGGDTETAPKRPKHWWGAQKQQWFKDEHLAETPFAGYYLGECAVATDAFRIPPKEMEEMLPQQLLMLQSAAAAMADAGLSRQDNEKAGVFVGIALDLNSTNFSFRWSIKEKAGAWARELGRDVTEEELATWVESLREQAGPPLTANRTMGALGSVVASRVAREFRVGGPSFTISNEENSGVRALETAVRLLQNGEIEHALVGAVDLAGDLRAALGHHMARPFSASGMATPFDLTADGSLIGEGAASVVLKRLEDAQSAGDRIYAVIKGIGASGGDPVLPGKEAYGRALERAYGEAGIAPDAVSYIEAHGSGHPAEDRMETAVLERFFAPRAATVLGAPSSVAAAGNPPPNYQRRCAVASVKGEIGHSGAASGLASLVRGCLALYQEIIPANRQIERPVPAMNGDGPLYLPRTPRYWLRNRVEGPRHAGVSVFSVDGNCAHVVLEGCDANPERSVEERVAPLGPGSEFLFTISGADSAELQERLKALREKLSVSSAADLPALARGWQESEQPRSAKALAVSFVARSREDAIALVDLGAKRVLQGDDEEIPCHPSLRDRLFYTTRPIGRKGKIGFVFPGSGNHFAGMGMELSARWPEVYRRQDAENQYLRDQFQPEEFWNGPHAGDVDENHLAVIFGQVAAGCATSDLVRGFGIQPQAVIGYSLGESAGLFSQRAWKDRDLMLSRMRASTLFTRDLAGECRAAQRTWEEPEGKPVHWSIGVVDASAREVRRHLKKISRVYLLIVNTPDECVVGGDVKWVKHLVAVLGCNFFPLKGVTTVHCEVARAVEDAYRELHLFPTAPPPGVTYYSGAKGASFELNRRNAAESIVANAIEGIDFPQVIESAYQDGVRCFLEMGPGASCTRMIGRILAGRPHIARSACPAVGDPYSALLRFLAQLTSERVAVDLQPLFDRGRYSIAAEAAAAHSKPMVKVAIGCEGFEGKEQRAERKEQRTTSSEHVLPTATNLAEASPLLQGKEQRAMSNEQMVPSEKSAQASPLLQGEGQGEDGATIHSSVPLNGDRKGEGAILEAAVTKTAAASGTTENVEPAPTTPASATTAATATSAPGPIADPLIRDFAAAQDAAIQAHEAYLRVAENLTRTMADTLSWQISLQEQMLAEGIPLPSAPAEIERGGQAPSEPVPVSTSIARGGQAPSEPVPVITPIARGGQAPSEPVPVITPVQSEGDRHLRSQSPPSPPRAVPVFDRDMCLEFAIGSVARMLGPAFAEADTYPTRVRLPDAPLMLVDRIVALEGEPKSMTHGRVVTEHDVHPGAWYLDGGRIPTCIAVEAGQADLFLSGYLGIDFITKGHAVYRLLDAAVIFHRELPGPGETINYDIKIERFFRQGDTYLFRFRFDATVNGEPLLTMRDGCAGFFSEQELAAGKGIVRGGLDLRPKTGVKPADWVDLVPMSRQALTSEQLERLRAGDLAGCFGAEFAGLTLRAPLTIPGGKMRLVHRVTDLVPDGGRYSMGFIQAEADIHPDDWFITCHFVDDRVMPGTLMYECCMHTLRIFLMRMGWIAEGEQAVWQPVPDVASRLCCRGQVLETTKVVTYEVSIRELGYRPEPYAIVDALMYADGKPIVEITNMSARLTGTNLEKLQSLWRASAASGADSRLERRSHSDGAGIQVNGPIPVGATFLSGSPEGQSTSAPVYVVKPAIYTKDQILAYSNGNPSEGFGDRYRVFDSERKIARLPGPPFQFMDRITGVKGEPWQMVAGAWVESQYDVPVDAWYFTAERQPCMPFSVLLEAALQPCGWLSAYVGSALTTPEDICYRNLGGAAVQHRQVTPQTGTLTATAHLKKVSSSGGMIIQEFDFRVSDPAGVVYEGETMFGFFAAAALANQIGIRDFVPYQPSAEEAGRGVTFAYPENAPFPEKALRMVDQVELFVKDGGPKGLGYLKGIKVVDPDEWFFKAHFYQDPVTPGSLGLESFLQLVKVAAIERWGWQAGDVLSALALEKKHVWMYRGQVVPTNHQVTIEAWITAADDSERILTADGYLAVDGRPIYRMNGFTVRLNR